ncbi:hypothetical protein [Mesorhizobium sp. M0306]|uniref:hypothetical protein n=1 Tax=unclassified Mesorhizobium TaxID=325217 RepID=UPI00333E1424
MSTRYATIIKDEEGQEIVSNIGQFEGGLPNIRSGTVEQVADGVMIGTVRGGPLNDLDGWGFPEGSTGGEGRAETIAKAGAKVLRIAKAAKGKAGKAGKLPAPEEPAEPSTDADE